MIRTWSLPKHPTYSTTPLAVKNKRNQKQDASNYTQGSFVIHKPRLIRFAYIAGSSNISTMRAVCFLFRFIATYDPRNEFAYGAFVYRYVCICVCIISFFVTVIFQSLRDVPPLIAASFLIATISKFINFNLGLKTLNGTKLLYMRYEQKEGPRKRALRFFHIYVYLPFQRDKWT